MDLFKNTDIFKSVEIKSHGGVKGYLPSTKLQIVILCSHMAFTNTDIFESIMNYIEILEILMFQFL